MSAEIIDRPEDDVWIDCPMGAPAAFCRYMNVYNSYGILESVGIVRFNLTAYVKHMIEQSK